MSIIFTRVRAQLRGVQRLNRMDNMEPQDDKELWKILGRASLTQRFRHFSPGMS